MCGVILASVQALLCGNAMSLCTAENSAVQKLSIIIKWCDSGLQATDIQCYCGEEARFETNM